jgi:hypothetical protein
MTEWVRYASYFEISKSNLDHIADDPTILATHDDPAIATMKLQATTNKIDNRVITDKHQSYKTQSLI